MLNIGQHNNAFTHGYHMYLSNINHLKEARHVECPKQSHRGKSHVRVTIRLDIPNRSHPVELMISKRSTSISPLASRVL